MRLRKTRLTLYARTQGFLALVILFGLLTSIGVILLSAAPHIRSEEASAMRVAEELVKTSVASLQQTPDPEAALSALVQGLDHVRHVRVTRLEPGRAAGPPPPRSSAFPAWLSGLIGEKARPQFVPISVRGKSLGTLVLTSDPDDEIDEIWQQICLLVGGAVLTAFVLFATASWLVRRTLRPMEFVAARLTELRDGNYAASHQIETGPPDFQRLSTQLNALAQTLSFLRHENARLVKTVVEAQEAERREIARDLHDELGPHLFALRAGTAMLHSAGVEGDAALQIARSAEAVQATHRRILARLRPVGLDEGDLVHGLEQLLLGWAEANPTTTLTWQLDPGLDALRGLARLTAYRIVQEALTNVAKHAKARRAKVIAAPERRGSQVGILIKVSDDGVGGTKSSRPGWGLRGMRERLEMLAGDLDISHLGESGIRVSAWIPQSAATPDFYRREMELTSAELG